MVRVRFTSHLERHLRAPDVRVEAGTVREALDAVFEASPLLRSYVLDDQGRVRKHVAVFLNGENVRDRGALSDTVADGDEIFVLQALSGG